MNVKLIHITPDAENVVAYCARVSSKNQDNPDIKGLLSYCAKHQHWSIFEMASMCVEIETSRAISAQILRHRSFSFQEFSQRYKSIDDCDYTELYEARQQAKNNRQSSANTLTQDVKNWWYDQQIIHRVDAQILYALALEKGIATECARMILPMSTKTRLYMHGTLRSWIHYIKLRTAENTQKEHRDIAESVKEIFVEQCPVIGEACQL